MIFKSIEAVYNRTLKKKVNGKLQIVDYPSNFKRKKFSPGPGFEPGSPVLGAGARDVQARIFLLN